MIQPSFDPGLTQQYTGVLKRAINKNGHFNVRRTGGNWRDIHPYLVLVNLSWPLFTLVITTGFIVVNTIFASLYCLIGVQHLKSADASMPGLRFLDAFFFSAHTLTTVGYGNIYPSGPGANAIASLEALVGLLGFAIATGLVFGRFSRPSARMGFSDNMIVAPYSGGTSLQFRVVNRRSNNLIDLDARLLLMTVDLVDGKLQRRFQQLNLERAQVLFMPLTWTIVHPIDENSPFYQKTREDLERLQAEVLIMMRAFDDTFGQNVHTRYSYRYDEIVWGAHFTPAFEVEKSGDMRVEINKVGSFQPVALVTKNLAPGS